MKTPQRPDVWAKLCKAYDANRGVSLTADDVTCLVSMDTAIMNVTHPERDGELPQPFARSKGHLYYVDGGQWFICRALNAQKARMVGVREFGRGQVNEVHRATDEEVDEYLRWKGLPKDHEFELEEPTS